MKKSLAIIGLPVLSVSEGLQFGYVKNLVINPQTFSVEYLLISSEPWYLGMRALAFTDVVGIGEYAVTTEKSANASAVGLEDPVTKLLDFGVDVKESQVITKRGQMVGRIKDYYIDEETGKIVGYELVPNNSEAVAGLIPAAAVITLGKSMTVVEDNVESALLKELNGQPLTARLEPSAQDAAPKAPEPVEETKSEALRLFEARQRQYLLGRIVSKTIIDDQGNVIVAEGTVVTEEIIDRVTAAGRYLELTMNTRG